MTDRANDPATEDFQKTAERSEAANIADESASYENAIGRGPEKPSDTAQAIDDEANEAAGDE